MLTTVLCVLGFIGLALVLMRMLQAMREIQVAVDDLRAKTEPLLAELRESVEEARDDLDRFDRVLGSAEAISSRVEGAVEGGPRRAVDARHQDRRPGQRHRTGRTPAAARRNR